MVLAAVPAFAETYYAKIENGIVTNVIVADSDFIRSQPGTWVQTWNDKPGTQYAGIGYVWNSTQAKAIPIGSPDIMFKTMKTNFSQFTNLLSSELAKYYQVKIVNMTLNGTSTK